MLSHQSNQVKPQLNLKIFYQNLQNVIDFKQIWANFLSLTSFLV